MIPTEFTFTVSPDALVGWKIKDTKKFLNAVKNSDFDVVATDYLSKMISAWSLEVPYNDPKSYDELENSQWAKMISAISTKIGESFKV